MKTKLILGLLTLAAVGSTCWFSAQHHISKAYASGFNDGTEAMLMHVLQNEIHLGPIVVENGATLSNMVVTLITWPEQEASGIRIEAAEGSCYMNDLPRTHTLITHNSFDFRSAWEIR